MCKNASLHGSRSIHFFIKNEFYIDNVYMKYYYSYVHENNYFKYNEQIKGINMNKQRYLKKSISVLVFTIPALIPLFVFWVYPICRSVWISFTDWDYMTPTYHFVFLKNYISLFKDTRFYEALLNTLIFTIGTLVPTIAIGLVLAVFLQKPFLGSGIIKFVLFSPWITPTVAISIVWTWIFQPDKGLANLVLSFFGLPGLEWISSSQTAMLSVIIVTVWKSIGYAMIFICLL
mgnify:FL=1